MRMKMIIALLLLGLTTQAQTNGGELSGRSKTGARLPVGVDSLAPLRGALQVTDSVTRVYTLAAKLRVDSLYIQHNIADGAANANYGGTKVLFKVSENTPTGYTDGRLQPPSITTRGELRVVQTGSGVVDVFSPSRSADAGEFVNASIDTFGNTRVHDSISWWQLDHIATAMDGVEGNMSILANDVLDSVAIRHQQIEDSLSLIRLQLRSELVAINNNTNTALGYQLGIRDTIGKIYNRIPSGMTVTGGGLVVSIDATDSTNLALAGRARAIYDSTWTVTAMDTAGLAAKANSATVGWQSDTIGIRQHKATDMKLGVKISFANTAPANDKACYIYACPWWYDGTNWYAASQGTTTLPTGANGTTTIASPNDLVLLGVLSYTTQNMVCQKQFMLSQAFGQTMPDAVSFIIINYTGAAIHTSGNLLYYSLVNKVQR